MFSNFASSLGPLLSFGVLIIGISFFVILSLIVTAGCFLMARNDEKRSGINRLSGKSAIIMTLTNKAWWTVFIGGTLVLVTFVLPGKTDLTSLRIGFALAIVGLLAVMTLGTLWRKWSRIKTAESLPNWNMFVKCYSGLNTFALFSIVVALVAFLFILLLELVFNDGATWKQIEDPFNVSLMLLASSAVFLFGNLSVFARSTDEIVLFDKPVEPKEE
ncbi:MAG: hypothetical protein VB980_01690 [Opitutales bacterium]|jgi:hypothetical protein